MILTFGTNLKDILFPSSVTRYGDKPRNLALFQGCEKDMGLSKNYLALVKDHYETIWKNKARVRKWDRGPMDAIAEDFRVLEFPPNMNRKMWTYATAGLSTIIDDEPIELHLFSSEEDENLVELLTMIGCYHRQTASLGLHHTVNFGRGWRNNSMCRYGFISLPYLDGPDLENLSVKDSVIKFYWLIPINNLELSYKKEYGSDALEDKFEEAGLDYLDPERASVV